MTRSLATILYSAAVAGALAFTPVTAMAQGKTAKACEEEWTAKKAELQAAKTKKKDFIAQCRATTAAATPPAAAPAAKPAPAAPAAKPTTTATTTEGKPGREAMVARERACGAEWKADKAAGKIPAGQTWPKYWSECDKRKKAAGM